MTLQDAPMILCGRQFFCITCNIGYEFVSCAWAAL